MKTEKLLRCLPLPLCLLAVYLFVQLGQWQGSGAALLLTLLLLALTLAWLEGGRLEKRFSERVSLRDYAGQLEALRDDAALRPVADHLIFLDREEDMESAERAALYAALDGGPMRAQLYWFVSLRLLGERERESWQAETFGSGCVIRLRLCLRRRDSRALTDVLRLVLDQLEAQGRVTLARRDSRLSRERAVGSFCYCLLRRRASGREGLSAAQLASLRLREAAEALSLPREDWFTEENSAVRVQWLPLSLEEDWPSERIRRRTDEY